MSAYKSRGANILQSFLEQSLFLFWSNCKQSIVSHFCLYIVPECLSLSLFVIFVLFFNFFDVTFAGEGTPPLWWSIPHSSQLWHPPTISAWSFNRPKKRSLDNYVALQEKYAPYTKSNEFITISGSFETKATTTLPCWQPMCHHRDSWNSRFSRKS